MAKKTLAEMAQEVESQEEKERWIKEVEEEERTKSLLLSRK